MLKSFTTQQQQQHSHRSSPTASPIFQHAPRSLPGSPLSRRPSQSTDAHSASRIAIQKKESIGIGVRYVDTGTQWSPPMIEKVAMEAEGSNDRAKAEAAVISPSKSDVERSAPPAAVPANSKSSPGISPTTSDIPIPPSPGMKRRPSSPPAPVPLATAPIIQKRSKLSQKPVKILPVKYEFCPVEHMVVLIANMIQELINTNDNLPLRSAVLTRFHSRTPPGISVLDYLHRLARHATLTPPILLSMVYYIDRLCLLYPAFTINSLTIHRFLITSATVASKGLSDSFWNNTTYARVGGIKVAELGMLELDFLYRVDWKIVPQTESLGDYYRGLVERCEGFEIDSEEEETTEEDEDREESKMEGVVKVEKDSPSKTEEAGTGAATREKWREWMDDVKEESKSPRDER